MASDKRGERKYLVDKCRDEMFWERAMWKSADLLSQNGTADDEDIIVGDDIRQFLTNSVPSEAEQVCELLFHF